MATNIKQFPVLPGSPADPNVETIKQAFAERDEPMADAEARTFTRELSDGRERVRREAEGMTRDERVDYLVSRLTDALNATPREEDGLLHLPVSKHVVARVTETFLNRKRP